jgi:hypothetical protein
VKPPITRHGGQAAAAADIMNKRKETWRSKPQIDTDETQIGKECFLICENLCSWIRLRSPQVLWLNLKLSDPGLFFSLLHPFKSA